jgi:shikimate kinase
VVALVGLPGAGKSSVAPRLAARLGWSWDDLDARMERESGRSVPELLRAEGEAAFRERERRALAALLEPAPGSPGGALVLACGGGVVVNEATRRLLAAKATVAWLTVRPESALARLGAGGIATRPLLAGDGDRGRAVSVEAPGDVMGRWRALQEAREALYAGLAAVTVTTDDRTLEEVAAALADALRERWAGSES